MSGSIEFSEALEFALEESKRLQRAKMKPGWHCRIERDQVSVSERTREAAEIVKQISHVGMPDGCAGCEEIKIVCDHQPWNHSVRVKVSCGSAADDCRRNNEAAEVEPDPIELKWAADPIPLSTERSRTRAVEKQDLDAIIDEEFKEEVALFS